MFAQLAINGLVPSLLAVTTAVGPATVLQLPAAVPGGSVSVSVVTVNGSGCPEGTAAVAVPSDKNSFTVTYSAFAALAGPGAAAADFRKNCQLVLDVRAPSGYSYAVSQVDYRGTASLESGSSATERAGYYFQGSSATTGVTHTVDGPTNGSWQTSDSVPTGSLVYSPCGQQRYLNVNTELRVSVSGSPTRLNSISMTGTTGSVNARYALLWKTC